jgi:hypothetical protein
LIAQRTSGSLKGGFESLKNIEVGHQSRLPYGESFVHMISLELRWSAARALAGWRSWVASTWLLASSSIRLASSRFGRSMIRCIFGRAWKPVFAPHQSSRRSQNFCSGADSASFQGPVTTGQPLFMSKLVKVVGSWLLKMCSGTITTPRSSWNMK